ncbi:Adenylate cyclase 2 [Mycobacterium attenuatum]|nr:Adenylate cyclase 2 [Mycobacterium attenuatum]
MSQLSASVLVVDDNLFCRTLLRASLSDQGYAVEVAHDGKEGLEKLKTGTFDLVILDLLMPVMDGLETLKWMKSTNAYEALPVIVVSAEDDLNSVVDCIEMGATDYLTKPFDPVQLLTRVRNALLTNRNAHRQRCDIGRVCVVDDERVSRMLLKAALEVVGYEVESAASGREAVAMLAEQQFDVILLDLLMEDLDGFEMLRIIQADGRLGGVPVIVVSGEEDRSAMIRCIEMGAEDYLTKPFDRTVLRARVKRCVERKQLRDQEVEYQQELERLNRSLKVKSRFIRETFGRYLSDDVVESILETPEALALGGELRVVTIMMSDLRGFTSIAERIGTESVVRLLNIYLDAMTELIFKYDGTIDEFLGDAILAVFGSPVQHGDDVERAVACALEMQQAMEDVNDTMRREGLPILEMGIALNTGEVIVGNIGSKRRLKYGVIGRNVNLTSRIESYTVGGQILVSDGTLQACGSKVRTGHTLTVSPKGIPGPIFIHEVLGITGKYEVSLREKQHTYFDLQPPLQVEFNVMEGKHGATETYRAQLVKVTEPERELLGEVNSERDCHEQTNLRLTLIPDGETCGFGEIYAKIIERLPGRPGEFRVRFTSVPPVVRTLLRAILDDRGTSEPDAVRVRDAGARIE